VRLGIALAVVLGAVSACGSPPADAPPAAAVAAPTSEVVTEAPDVDAAQMPVLCGAGGGPGRRRAPVSVRLGEIDGIPDADRASALRVLRRRVSDLIACYEAEVDARPATTGRITLALVVAPDGTVTRSRVVAQTTRAATLDDRTLERCVQSALAACVFPARSDARAWHLVVPVVLDPATE
jgi:hypothetical protein